MESEIDFDPYKGHYSSSSSLLRSSEIRDLMSIAGRPDIISFAGGLPFIEALSAEEISEIATDVLTNSHTEALQYCETEGRYSLKTRLLEIMAAEGINAEPEHILITTGSQQALDLVARLFINPGDPIVIEGPTYVGALSAFRPAAPTFVTIPLDEMGMRVEILERKLEEGLSPKFVYLVPNFNNPAGVTMSEKRREQLIELSRKYNLLTIEDNPYGLLRFEGKPLRPLVARDPQKVIYLGTLSKIISPGLRIGWVYGPLTIIERLTILKQSADLCSSSLNQFLAENFIARGLWKNNLEKIRPMYKSRRDSMLKALERYFPKDSNWTHPEGGLFIWVTLPEYLDTTKMLPLAIDSGVAFVPGVAFYPDASGKNKMRLNFSYPPEEQIIEGIKRLGKVIRKEIELYRSLGINRELS